MTAYPPWGDAEISACKTFRYRLQRRWGPITEGKAWLRFVMLNPSTADASQDDPTIRRCIGFAKREGYGAVAVLNLYAYRATSPQALLTCKDAVGPENDVWLWDSLRAAVFWHEPVVAAWGTNAQPDRVREVLSIVPNVDWRCLGTTKDGHPRHPLYVRGDQPLVSFGLTASAEGDARG